MRGKLGLESFSSEVIIMHKTIENHAMEDLIKKIVKPFGLKIRSVKIKIGIINQALVYWNGVILIIDERKRVNGKMMDVSSITLKPKIEEKVLKVKKFKQSTLFNLIALYFKDTKIIN